MTKSRTIVRWVLRVLIAALFVFSAVSKLMPSAIDQFELYLYSFGFFPLNCCFILARLCIGTELVLALFTLCGWFPRTLRLVTSGLLLLFSIFLCYASLIGRNDSCQCFGEWVNLTPLWSLFKNAVLLALVLVYYKLVGFDSFDRKRWKLIVASVCGVGLMVLPFVVSIPDSWYFGPEKQPYNPEALTEWYDSHSGNQALTQSRNQVIVAFVTPRCHYCQLARKKLDAIISRHHIDPSLLLYVEPLQKENTPGAIAIPAQQFIDITRGTRPLVFLLDGPQVVATYHLRNIDENQIANFFK